MHFERVLEVDNGHMEGQDVVGEGTQQQAAPLKLTGKIKIHMKSLKVTQ